MPKTFVKPIAYDEVHQEYTPVTDGQYVDTASIPVDESIPNALSVTSEGLKVSPEALVSDADGNQLQIQDGKMYVAGHAVPVIVSADEGNLIREGNDKGAFFDGNDLLSNGDINLLTISEVDHKILLTRANVLNHLIVVSTDEGNLISKGSDGGALLTKDDIISNDDDVLTVDPYGKLVTELSMHYNTTTGELRLLGVDDVEVGHVVVPTSTSALKSVEFARSMPDKDGEAVEGDYFVTLAFKVEGQDTWDGGDGVRFTTVKGTPATQVVEYEMNTSLGEGSFPDRVKAIFLGQSIEQAVVSGGNNVFEFPDGSRLILTWTGSTGTTITVSAAFTPAIGIKLGSFLRMTWLLADGSVQDVYLEMTDIYTAGDGLTIDDTGLIKAVVTETGGLQVDATGIAVKPVATGGIQTGAEGVSLKVDPAGGLQTTSDGAGLKLDGTSMVSTENGLAVSNEWFKEQVANEVRTTELITAGDGIRVETTVDGRRVSAIQGDGIIVSGAGISVDDEWLAEQITNQMKTDTDLVAAGDGITVTPTENGVIVAADSDWIDGYIADQIKNDDTLLVKGNGITLTSTKSGRQISVDAGTGITVDTDGINVDATWLDNRITDKVKGDATLITAGAGVEVTATDTGAQVAVDTTWLADQVTEQMRTDEGLVQAGDGISITVTDDGKIVTANAGTGITVNTDGINVDTEWLADQVTNQVKTDASLVVAGSGLTEVVGQGGKTLNVGPGAGISVTENAIAVDTTWLGNQIATKVESGDIVTAGDGIDVTASEGKAEVAVDDTVVRTSGDQTISGRKIFSEDIVVQRNDSCDVYTVHNATTKGTAPAENALARFIFADSTGLENVSTTTCRLGSIDLAYSTTGSTTARILAYKPEQGSAENAAISVVYPATGEPYTEAPSTRATPANTEIVTVGYLKGANSGVVHTTGKEDISGVKNFHSNQVVTYDNPVIRLALSESTKGEVPSERAHGEIWIQALSGYTDPTEHGNDTYGYFGASTETDGSSRIYMRVMTPELGSGSYGAVTVIYPASGDPYAVAPSTRATPDDHEIITYDFLQSHVPSATFVQPYMYERPSLMTSAKTSVTVPAGTEVTIDGQYYRSTAATTLQTTDVRAAGTDAYVYAVVNSGALGFVLSTNSTVPTGYNANNSRKIGGFHMLCADVGTISGHPLSGYTAGDILPASVWDLKHRARSENEGMVYIAEKGIWVDIYLSSWDGDQLVSSFGGTTADGYSATPFHADKFTEEFGNVGKRNPWRHEFQVFAKGSNEGTNIQGTADPGTTGGHTDTAGRRMISKDGLEDCCGVLWQWAEDVMEGGAYGTYIEDSGNYYLTGYNWNMAGDWTSEEATNPVNAVWNPVIDGDGTAYGGAWGLPRRLHVGARWDDGLHCGSRAVHCNIFPARRASHCGGRGVSEPRPLGA